MNLILIGLMLVAGACIVITAIRQKRWFLLLAAILLAIGILLRANEALKLVR
jgi:uncharacterized membrane protein YhfC